MMEKIEWYQEVLKLDPDSKVFFPLAKLLRDSQQPDKAPAALIPCVLSHRGFAGGATAFVCFS